ncbi:DUF2812 domain-containing protein [Enterococcus faecium]|nr:DUF2812 domain-containing protein [Enterococcus faecium]MDT2780234.1 DUF2812 domain-containing protein [Enterococcus lactis]MDK4348172.1 DUF2812 domain-containing protein [Enterococcus faecium]MDK4386991.1 DUF2812 domain-containing protein [Enterococcus faecium]MDK4434862.1 DUF2812 domain-containing protein [Enterococcus faecium]MDT2804931.1 DUF2812 domain-containing protein [Enterococcus lactis]
MQEEGYRLVSVSSVVPIYTFEKLASKEKFIPYVRLDFREKSMGKIKYEDYVTLFSDSSWKLIKGSRSGSAQYFQQEYPDVTRDIFSDTDSQESVKKRYVKYGYTYGTLFLLYFFIFFSSNSWNLDKILNFKSWYFTQGLWEMEGMWFWKAFIFETPFVLLRVLPLFFFLFLGIYYLLRSLINDDSTVITKYFV